MKQTMEFKPSHVKKKQKLTSVDIIGGTSIKPSGFEIFTREKPKIKHKSQKFKIYNVTASRKDTQNGSFKIFKTLESVYLSRTFTPL